MENVYEQFIDEAGSTFEHWFAMMCPKLTEANASGLSEQNGIGAILQRSVPDRAAAHSPGEKVSTTATMPSWQVFLPHFCFNGESRQYLFHVL